MRYFAHIAYNGYRYSGWQNQRGATTIQGTIESAFKQLFGQKVNCHGCGRTDTKVHASSYYFHFDTEQAAEPNLKYRLNRILPADIVVFDIFEVDARHDAQHSAIQRTYQYRIHTKKNPFIAQFSVLYDKTELDISLMKKAVQSIPLYSNFVNFCITPARHDSVMVNVYNAELTTNNNRSEICFTITANRFLHGMIRIIAYRLIQIGAGQMSLDTFIQLLNGEPTSIAVKKAYAQGLTLTDVKYDFGITES